MTDKKYIYIKSAQRRMKILEAACRIAEKSNYKEVRRHQLAKMCSTADGNISRIMGTMDELRAELIRYAIEQRRYNVVAQAILDKHPECESLQQGEKVNIMAAAVI